MKKQSHSTGKQNIVIKGVTQQSITLDIDGEVQEINNNIDELKTVSERLDSPKVQVGEKIYNIGEIGQAEFKTIINQYRQESRRSYYLRLFMFIFVPVLAVSIAYLLYQYRVLQQPLVFTVTITNQTPNPYLPMEKATVTLEYGDERKTRVVEKEAIFKGIPANFREKPVRVLFQSEGFIPIDKSFNLTKNHIDLPVKRNENFAKIVGIVKEQGSGSRLGDVKVSAGDAVATTDGEGKFTLSIPFSMQRKQQRVRAYKEGYKEWDRIEPVIANVETIIYLQKRGR